MKPPYDPRSWSAAFPPAPWPPVAVARRRPIRRRELRGPVRRTLRLVVVSVRRRARRR